MTEPDSKSSPVPDSSKVSSPVVRRTKPERRWQSWCGELQDLRRLVTMTEELAEQRRAQMLAELADDDENERKGWGNRSLLIKMELLMVQTLSAGLRRLCSKSLIVGQ